MGALHDGHISLVEASKKHNDVTVCSIFVNPTQFNNPSDLQKYPRTLDQDTEQLKKVECEVIFCPEVAEIYPNPSVVRFDFGTLDKVMEGQFRPGHFSGVAQVVSKLFHIVEPHNAYFGQKDWQQFAIIRQLVEDLNFNLRLHSIPTLREKNGLAMSSRNLRLTESQRQHAGAIFQALNSAKDDLLRGIPIAQVKTLVQKKIEQQPQMVLEYFEVADSKNLTVLKNVSESTSPILCIAVFAGDVRLIDNLFLIAPAAS
jgi:pantoate--beta-alanine ligase